jgi:integrase
MPKARLTAALAASATCNPSRKKITTWDTVVTGFILETRPNGSTYALRYIDEHGTQRQHRIGAVGEISHAEAEKRAKRLRSEVVLGGNPAAQRRERRSVPVFGDVARQHLEFAQGLKSFSSTEMAMRVHILPKWSKVRLTDITPQQVARWLQDKDDEGLAPASVERIKSTFGRTFELARRWNIPGAEINPVRGLPRPKFDNRRTRYLTADEAARLLEAAATSPNPQLRNIVGLLMLTGARTSELLKAEWRHVDIERRTWLIPTTKNGKARHVPLSHAALDIIEQLPRFAGCPYLVPNPETRLPFVTLKHSWHTARKAAGLPDLHIHDLRHSFASACVNSGIDLLTVGKVLGHTDYKSTLRYSHLADSTLRAAVEAGAAKLSRSAK